MSRPRSYVAASATDDTLRHTSVPQSRLRRRRQIPLLVAVITLVTAGVVVAIPDAKLEVTWLGASGTVSGGIARVNGVIPLESDNWLPEDPSISLNESASQGTHRVRIILELTALDPDGLRYRAGDYTVAGWGSAGSRLLWADPASAMIAQGEVVTVTQVFEIPDKAFELTLRADESLFALGTGHHTR